MLEARTEWKGEEREIWIIVSNNSGWAYQYGYDARSPDGEILGWVVPYVNEGEDQRPDEKERERHPTYVSPDEMKQFGTSF